MIVVDYQNDFVSGALGFPAAEAIEGGILAKIRSYQECGDHVLFTFDTHYDEYYETQEGRRLPVKHCVQDSEGWQLYGRVKDLRDQDSIVISKYTFGSIDLADHLRKEQYDAVELVGVVTEICVISNAVIAKAALPEAEITIDAACTASHDPVLEQKALDVMAGLQMNVIRRV